MNKPFAVLCLGLAGCNFDVGDCYLRSEGESGAGGIIITATAPAASGSARQGSVASGPCRWSRKTWIRLLPSATSRPRRHVRKNARWTPSLTIFSVGKMEDEAQRTACRDSAYARYKSCREGCEQTSNQLR